MQKKHIPKAQHVVPRMHLQHFAGPEPKGMVWTYDRQAGTARPARPEETAVITHFYTAESPDGEKNTSLEDYLEKIETKAAPVYRNLLQGIIPGEDQSRADFSSFLALAYVRTPQARRMAAELYALHLQMQLNVTARNDKAFENSVGRYEKETGITLDAPTREKLRKDLLDPSGYNLLIPKEHTFSALSAADKLQQVLFDMKWSIGIAQHGFFITSDNPLIKRIKRGTSHPLMGDGGFLNKTAEVTFPLSPQKLLILTWNQPRLTVGGIRRTEVEAINNARASFSEAYLYAHIHHKKILKLAAKHKESRQKFTSSFEGGKFGEVIVPRRWKNSGGQ